VEETLPSSFLESLGNGLISKTGLKALRAAEALLNSSDSTAAVLHAWGGGGAGSVAHSKQAFARVLREYAAQVAKESPCVAASGTNGIVDSGQSVATLNATSDIRVRDPQMLACRSIRELGVPHFLWEFVRQAVLLATVPDYHDGLLGPHQRSTAVVALLTRASRSGLVLRNQLEHGFAMAKAVLQESPTQANSFKELMQQLQAAGLEFMTQGQTEQSRTGVDDSADGPTSMASEHSSRLLASQARQSRNLALREAGK